MIINLLMLIFIGGLFAFVIYTLSKMNSSVIQHTNQETVSFQESMDLLGMPVVTFKCGRHKLNFLLDTGSNLNCINKDVLSEKKNLIIKENSTKISVHGVEGNKVDASSCIMTLEYKKNTFDVVFTVSDLKKAFDHVKNDNGVTLHGILGSKFFEDNKYIIDFEHLKVYIK